MVSFTQRMGTRSFLGRRPDPVRIHQKQLSAYISVFIKLYLIKSFIIGGNDSTYGCVGQIGLSGKVSCGRFTQAVDHLKHTPFVEVWQRAGMGSCLIRKGGLGLRESPVLY
jgi:hypothetical protein